MNWLKNFKPKMVVFVHPCPQDPTALMVQAVCARRVFNVRYKVAVRKAGNDKTVLKLLRRSDER